MIAGMDLDYEGHIRVNDETVTGPGPMRGIVFQESRLLPWFNVHQNVAFALSADISTDDRKARIASALHLVELAEASRYWPYQLSGGMEKRVALARALVNLPDLLLLDEPFAALDPFSRFSLQDELTSIHSTHPITTLLVTHDVDEAVQLCDRILVLSQCPSHVAAEHLIDYPRPRERSSPRTAALRAHILELMRIVQCEQKTRVPHAKPS